MALVTVGGGAQHGLSTLSHAERQAAQHAISKISGTSGGLGSGFGQYARSATLIGGSVKSAGLSASTLLRGVGSDTFIGGARSFPATSIGNDTVVSGSAKLFDRTDNSLGTHDASKFSLSSDTINVAGATALTVRGTQPDDKAKSHTVTLGDKTTVTITGVSTHDITKFSH